MIEDLLTNTPDDAGDFDQTLLTMPVLDMTEGQIESLNLFRGFTSVLIYILLGAMFLVILYELLIGSNFIIPFFG